MAVPWPVTNQTTMVPVTNLQNYAPSPDELQNNVDAHTGCIYAPSDGTPASGNSSQEMASCGNRYLCMMMPMDGMIPMDASYMERPAFQEVPSGNKSSVPPISSVPIPGSWPYGGEIYSD